jgi:uncharacterized RDD family membrane protein YckC
MVYCSKCGMQNTDGARYCNNCAAALALTESGAPPSQPAQAQQPAYAVAPLPASLQPGQKATLLDYLSHYKGLQYHWARRFVAILFDVIVLWLPVYIVMVISGLHFWGFFGFLGFGGILLFLYSALFEYMWGGTIGKMVLGLKVVSTKGKLDIGDALIRNISKVYSIFLLIELIITLVVETTDAHQRFLDKIARTTVVEKTNPQGLSNLVSG